MIRGVISSKFGSATEKKSLSTKITYSLNLISTNRSGALGTVSKSLRNQQIVNFTSVVPTVLNTVHYPSQIISKCLNKKFLEPHKVLSQQARTVIKFSYKKGKRKSVGAVTKRFFRLHWGIWIRTIAGRHKKLWNKSAKRRNFYLKHVFCNSTQSKMLDKMVNKFWRKPKYYLEDPYAPYHKRENFAATRTKPWRPEGVDYE